MNRLADWVSRATLEPLEVQTVTDAVELHRQAEIDLRVVPLLLELWNEVIASTLEFSGIRLANARR